MPFVCAINNFTDFFYLSRHIELAKIGFVFSRIFEVRLILSVIMLPNLLIKYNVKESSIMK